MTEYRVGDDIKAFHPRMFGVVKRGTVVKVGRKWLHIDFGPLAGGVFKVAPERHHALIFRACLPARPPMAEKLVGRDGESPVPLFAEKHTEAELEEYLDALRDGMGLDLAARRIGLTATRMRRFANRDLELQHRIIEALAEGREHYQDELRATAHDLALDTENPNPRILEVELATHGGPDYAHLRRDRIKHEGRVEHALVIDLSQLDELPLDKLREIEAALAPVVIDQEPRELTG